MTNNTKNELVVINSLYRMNVILDQRTTLYSVKWTDVGRATHWNKFWAQDGSFGFDNDKTDRK